jgi:hypothetical protein
VNYTNAPWQYGSVNFDRFFEIFLKQVALDVSCDS